MKIKFYTYLTIFTVLFSAAQTLHGMKKIPSTGFKLITLLGKKNITKNITKNVSLDIKKEIIHQSEYSAGNTKIYFSENNKDIGHSIYANDLRTDTIMAKKYVYLTSILVYDEYRKLGYGSKIVELTKNIIYNSYFPRADIIKFDVLPFGIKFNSRQESILAQKKLHEFYIKLDGITDKEKNTGYFDLSTIKTDEHFHTDYQ